MTSSARGLAVVAVFGLSAASAACTVRMELPTDAGSRDARLALDARPDAGGCSIDRECTDRIACSIDRCASGACTHTACVDCCPDGLACEPTLGCSTPPVPCTVDGECSDGIRCTLDSCGTDGFCERRPEPGLCAAGEICLSGVGCIPTPPTSCSTVEDCRRGSLCAADWLCEPEFGCTFVAPLNCDDDDDCTVDGCDDGEGGCTHTPIDIDMDDHAPSSCAGGDDCNDSDPDVSPDATEVCNTIDDDCDATVDEGCCTPGPCTTSCGTAGTMGCNPDGTAMACVAPVEACNGSDDDCDTMTDEGCCTSGPCTTSCGTTGVRGCNPDGSPGACMAPAETCNDIDDNCSGGIDEGFACRVGFSSACTTGCGSLGTRACLPGCTLDAVCVPPTETCNGADDDCDGMVDDGFTCPVGGTRACTTSCGSTGMQTCVAGCSWDACVAPTETCNGVDDDCDGTVDDGFACRVGTSMPCTTSCGSAGSRGCLSGCTLDPVCAPPAETCNDIDDDCDGTVDDGFACRVGTSSSCTTTCGSTGSRACLAGCAPATTCTPPVETCNGLDDDCDGRSDETFACAAGSVRSCTTSCGSTSTQTCSASCTLGACTPPAETCNGVDDDCDSMIDDGFACRLGSSLSCPTSCGSTGSRACLPGCTLDAVCAPPAETCNGIDDNCNTTVDDGFTCAAGTTRDCTLLGYFDGDAACRMDCSGYDASTCTNCGNGTIQAPESCDGAALGGATCMSRGYFAGTLRCAAGCAFDETSCTNCGNGTIQSGESCDGSALGGATCASRGYATGTLRCGATCAYDESMCSNCGNGVVNPPEACDGAALGGATCMSLGYASGTLSCQAGCTYNTGGCTYCGNGVINPGEDCDGMNLNGNSCTTVPGGFSGGTLRCTSACRFSTSMCTAPWNPSGTYTTTPTISYMCAYQPLFGFYAVDYDISQFGFTDNGTTLTVSGANCGPSPGMTGAAVSRTTPRSFDVTCTYSGSCSETYRLTGTFDTDNHWNGTFYRSFSGSCFDCTAGMTSVSGMR